MGKTLPNENTTRIGRSIGDVKIRAKSAKSVVRLSLDDEFFEDHHMVDGRLVHATLSQGKQEAM